MLTKYIDLERLTHSAKTAIACLIGFILAKVVGLPSAQWILITIIIVMCAQIYVGSVLKKAYSRLLGTLSGCLLAAVVIQFMGISWITIALALIFCGFMFSYIATSHESLSNACTLGAVTTALILMNAHPTIIVAGERFMEISIGIVIATLISQFILPIHARTHLRESQADSLQQLRDFYDVTMVQQKVGAQSHYQELDETIVKSLLKQRQLAKESAGEKLGKTFDANHFFQSLYCEREILRTIAFMFNAISHLNGTGKGISHLASFENFNDAVLLILDTIIRVIHEHAGEKEHVHLPPLAALKTELELHLKTDLHGQALYADGFLFSAEILSDCLERLAELYNVKIYP